MEVHDSLDENVINKDVAYLVKNFRKFLKFKNNGKFGDKGKFQSSEKEKKEFKRKVGRSPILLKESLASSATDMDTSRKNVLIVENEG